MTTSFAKIQERIAENRLILTNILLEFVKTDTLLFAFNKECLECFSSMVMKANGVLGTTFVSGCDLKPAECNSLQGDKICEYLQKLPDHIFMGVYFMAREVRSVLLAILFIEKMISKKQVLHIAFYEERYQQKQWGITQEALDRYGAINVLLSEIAKMCDEEDISFEN